MRTANRYRRRAHATWITRQVVADLLGVSVTAVRRMQDRKELSGIKDPGGVHRFFRPQIVALAHERGLCVDGVAPPKVQAEAFELFAEGKTWQDAVIALKLPIDVARKLSAAYREEPLFPSEDERDEDEDEDAAPAEDDEFAALQREQEEARRLSQEASAREHQAWEESHRRHREEETARRLEEMRRARMGLAEREGDSSSLISPELLTMLFAALARRRA